MYSKYAITIDESKAVNYAVYIVNYCSHRNYYIDNYRLGPYLFYAQAHHLFGYNKPLFEDDIIATENGAMVRAVYKQFGVFGSAIIPEILRTEELNEKTWSFEYKGWEDNLTFEEANSLSDVAEYFKDYGIVGIWEGMKKQTPWIKARKRKDKKVDNADLLCFFKYS